MTQVKAEIEKVEQDSVKILQQKSDLNKKHDELMKTFDKVFFKFSNNRMTKWKNPTINWSTKLENLFNE